MILTLIIFSLSCSPEEPQNYEKKDISGKKLSQPSLEGKMSLEETLTKRRSQREFTNQELSEEQISQLCWAAQGITSEWGGRTAPSAGALYPLELYIATSQGVFHYLPSSHSLEEIKKEDVRSTLSKAALFQSPVKDGVAVFIITAVYERTEKKYKEKAERYVRLEAGHAGQNILLQAVALDLGAVPIGAFSDSQVQKVLGIPSDHQPLYLIPVGYTKLED